MKTVIIIPARLASSRLPEKALLAETGKTLIQHVYERAIRVPNVADVIVATDHQKIMNAVQQFGGTVVMTSADHVSGTDRIAEVANSYPADCYVNLQGDEPYTPPEAVSLLVEQMHAHPSAEMGTLATPIQTEEVYHNPNCVKVVCTEGGKALYFSRSPIPYSRDVAADFTVQPPRYLHHLGIYAYRREALLKLAGMPPHPLELIEKLEQLRAIAAGWTIQVGVVQHFGRGIDTPEDYQRFVEDVRTGRFH
ncbi:MAG: 3-deoxy-manno-octulosonate cytidylyltransferase [Zavarzinella sp.]